MLASIFNVLFLLGLFSEYLNSEEVLYISLKTVNFVFSVIKNMIHFQYLKIDVDICKKKR